MRHERRHVPRPAVNTHAHVVVPAAATTAAITAQVVVMGSAGTHCSLASPGACHCQLLHTLLPCQLSSRSSGSIHHLLHLHATGHLLCEALMLPVAAPVLPPEHLVVGLLRSGVCYGDHPQLLDGSGILLGVEELGEAPVLGGEHRLDLGQQPARGAALWAGCVRSTRHVWLSCCHCKSLSTCAGHAHDCQLLPTASPFGIVIQQLQARQCVRVAVSNLLPPGVLCGWLTCQWHTQQQRSVSLERDGRL
jgi:hypothetical protein